MAVGLVRRLWTHPGSVDSCGVGADDEVAVVVVEVDEGHGPFPAGRPSGGGEQQDGPVAGVAVDVGAFGRRGRAGRWRDAAPHGESAEGTVVEADGMRWGPRVLMRGRLRRRRGSATLSQMSSESRERSTLPILKITWARGERCVARGDHRALCGSRDRGQQEQLEFDEAPGGREREEAGSTRVKLLVGAVSPERGQGL